MKKAISILAVFLFFIHCAFAQCVINYSNWQLVDDYRFTSQRNFLSQWNRNVFPGACVLPGTTDYAEIDPASAYINNGYLNLDATRQASSWTQCIGGKQILYKAGWVESVKSYQSGLFEVRCKMPSSSGVEAAFWLFGAHDKEMDIFEFGGEKPGEFSTSLVDWDAGPNPVDVCSQFWQDNHCNDLTEEFHTYALAWTSQYVTFFFDGKEQWTKSTSYFTGGTNYPLKIYLDINVNDWATFSQSKFLIEYVKVYSLVDTNTSYMIQAAPLIPALFTTYEDVYNAEKSMAVGENNSIFYRDKDNWIQQVYPTTTNWYNAFLTTSWDVNETAGGDIAVNSENERDHVFYRNKDGYVYRYHWPVSGWVAEKIEDTAQPYTANMKMSAVEGSLAVGKCNTVYYMGADNWLQVFYYDNGWKHSYLTQTWDTLEKAMGDVVVSGTSIFYKGLDQKIHVYFWNPTSHYATHQVVGTYSHPNFYVSSAPGSLAVGKGRQLFYRTVADWIEVFNESSGSWSHAWLSTAFNSSELAYGNVAVTRDNVVYYKGNNDTLLKYEWSGSAWNFSNTGTKVRDNITTNHSNFVFFRNLSDKPRNIYWTSCQRLLSSCDNYQHANEHRVRGNTIQADEFRTLNVYPNPVSHLLNVEAGDWGNTLEIWTLEGRMIHRQENISPDEVINVQAYPAGIYLLKVYGNTEVKMTKFLVTQVAE